MKIVIGIARGLKYLHTEVEPPFTISELNSSAVYLTEEFSPKVRPLVSSLQIIKLGNYIFLLGFLLNKHLFYNIYYVIVLLEAEKFA